MLAKSDVAKIYETVLSIPGMDDKVKIVFTISRKNVLLLSKVIERGLIVKTVDDKPGNILEILTGQTLEEIKSLPGELLEKAGLTEMNNKLQSF